MPLDSVISYRASLPGAASDGTAKSMRGDQYGAVHTRNEIFAWAEEGTYFRAIGNATPLTGIAQSIQTSFSATNAFLCIVNGSASIRVIPHYIRLTNTATGSISTSSALAVAIDSANRYSSSGTDLTGLIVNSNTSLGPSSGVTVLRAGTVTASAAGAGTRYVSNTQLKVQASPCWAVGDEILLTFGEPGNAGAAGPMSGTTPICILKNIGPVVLGGQNSSLLIHIWNPGNASIAPSWAVEMAWWER